ncbi:MAG: Zn-dependent exopeptidase M28 [Kofleriaceae bacterium]|nr:Zn-dependent exopeptidase M28 [Kofleriaceae bacterium]
MRSSTLATAALAVAVLGPATGIGGPGCDGGAGAPDAAPGDVDAAPAGPIDAAPAGPDAMVCAPDACPWIESYLREVLGVLTGEQATPAGVTLTARASAAQRDATRAYLQHALGALGLTPELHVYDTGKNVVVHLPASGGAPGPLVVVGAHFDGVAAGPAAADNGTGTAMVLAIARYLAPLPGRTHPVDLVLFDQEEVGLVGSHFYALDLATAGTDVEAVHIYDMISFDGDGDRAIELWSPSPALEAAYRAHAEPRGIPVEAVTFGSSDHQSFLDRGFTAVGVCEEFVSGDHTPDYHEASDTFDKIDFAYLTEVTRLAMAILGDEVTAP